MPNWCQNEVSIHFDNEKDCQKFKSFVKSKESLFDFNKIIPPTKKVLESLEPNPNYSKELGIPKSDYWYDWRRKNWGTKWPAVDVNVEEGNLGYVFYSFDTAWSPPDKIYEALVKKFPDAEISWFFREDGVQCAGWL